MSAATVSEPFLLSSYPESSNYKKRKATPLYVALPSGSDADPFVTVAVQGDGVHILDTSTLHPAASHTLGPSTSFSCPPATRTSQAKGGVRICTTYAVLESGPDMHPDGKGMIVLAWEEHFEGGISTSNDSEKKKKVAPHPVAHIYAPDYLPTSVVLVSATGDVSIADEELRVQRTCTPQNQQPSTLVKHFLFSAASCSFLPSHTTSPYSAISLAILRSGDVLRLNVVGVAGENVSSVGECVVPIEETDILDISCSETGFISILAPSGFWTAFSLTTSSSSLTVTQAAEPLRLQGLTFINTPRISEASIAALTSSHVLLSAITTGSVSEIVLLLWDLRYGVLLAQQTIPVPSTLPRPKKQGAVLQLVAPSTVHSSSASKAGSVNLNPHLALLPSPDRDQQQGETGNVSARSTLLVVPLTVPATSTIAAAMGKANTGARWVCTKSARGQAQPPRGAPEMSAAARKVLGEMKAAIDGSANGSSAGGETAFFEFVKQQSKGKGTAQGEVHTVPLEYPFVQGVLELVLRAPSNPQRSGAQGKVQGTGAYSAKVVTHLLESRTVSSAMVEGGVLPALAARNDWDTATLAMRTVSDLPENDIMALLSQVVAAHRRTSSSTSTSTDDNAMDVDSTPAALTSTPALPAFLAQCVVYPYTPALQRTALRKHLADAADQTAVLELLDKWIVHHTADDALLAPSAPSTESAGVPPLDKVLAFVQTLLDASFLALLAHTPAHRLLRTLSGHVEPALARSTELEVLCGPLEPFARAAAAKAKAQAETKDSGIKAGADGGKDWRRKRKMAHEQAGIAVGLYQVEELVL